MTAGTKPYFEATDGSITTHSSHFDELNFWAHRPRDRDRTWWIHSLWYSSQLINFWSCSNEFPLFPGLRLVEQFPRVCQNKTLIRLGSNFMSQHIMGLPTPGYLLVYVEIIVLWWLLFGKYFPSLCITFSPLYSPLLLTNLFTWPPNQGVEFKIYKNRVTFQMKYTSINIILWQWKNASLNSTSPGDCFTTVS